VVTHVKVGDRIEAGAPAFTIHANDEGRLAPARAELEAALSISSEEVPPLAPFYATIYGDD